MIKKFYNINDLIEYCKLQYVENDVNALESFLNGRLKFFRFDNFSRVDLDSGLPILFITEWDAGRLVGVLKLLSIYNYLNVGEPLRTLMYLTVDSEYQNTGVGTRLLRELFDVLKFNKIEDPLYLSPYSELGYNYIKPVIERFSKDYNINIISKKLIWDI